MQETAQSVIEHLECKSLLCSANNVGYTACTADVEIGILGLVVRPKRWIFFSHINLYVLAVRFTWRNATRLLDVACVRSGDLG